MAARNSYKDYFNIDPKYYAAVTKELIDKGEVKWQSFYPHESFIKLLENVHKALSGGNGSVWLEGAYGTGKSHAALVVKSLLEASESDVRAYFADYELNNDLCQKLITDKKCGTLVVVHRIGSSDIRSDADLVLAVQESIEDALEKAGIENKGKDSLKNAALKWFKSQESNRTYFNNLLKENEDKYALDFSGQSGDEVFKLLEESDDPDEVFSIMQSVLKVAKDNGINVIQLDKSGLCSWITEVIQENNISSILFIWDEFTEFFQNNPNSLSGFQTLVELGTTVPFYFLIVTHESTSLIKDTETRKKIMGRFVGSRAVRIELPENISFRLMAKAMKETDDPELKKNWKKYKGDLNNNLYEVRTWLKKESNKNIATTSKTAITDDDLCNIVPIHPYAALVLKHISVAFQSNARSMFDFIINDDPDIKSFKWFIAEHTPIPITDESILTIDMLWDFFTAKTQVGLSDDVRVIFDSLSRIKKGSLTPDDERVFKTVALLEAISKRVSGVEILRPTPENVDMAFCGVWDKMKAIRIADGLRTRGALFERMGTDEYTVARTGADTEGIDDLKKEIMDELKTEDLIGNAELLIGNIPALNLPACIRGRFVVVGTGSKSFVDINNNLMKKQAPNKFKLLALLHAMKMKPRR